MTATQPDGDLQTLIGRIQECIAPYAGRVEYGNLRHTISSWDCGGGESTTNIALVYETPGGSTDQINISYYHSTRAFSLIDAHEGEFTTQSPEDVIEAILPRITGIPDKRREHLLGEIRRQIDSGSSHTGVVGHLNRMMNSGFKGGTMTIGEMRDAMTYAVRYMKDRNFPGSNGN